MKTLTALIPFFNEERTIAELVRQLDSLPGGILTECIFVDDGSTDSSSQILSKALTSVHFKPQIISKANGGKASAIKEGAKALTTTHVVILDSDLELATSDIERLWQVVQSGENDFVFGYDHGQSSVSQQGVACTDCIHNPIRKSVYIEECPRIRRGNRSVRNNAALTTFKHQRAAPRTLKQLKRQRTHHRVLISERKACLAFIWRYQIKALEL